MPRHRNARVPPRAIYVVAALTAVLLAGCDMCDEGATRCSDNVAQVCEDRDWEDREDCGARGLQCGADRTVCHSFFDLGIGSVWCCYSAQ